MRSISRDTVHSKNFARTISLSFFSLEIDLKVGDRVWLYTPQVTKGLSSKLAHIWNGPYRIIRKLSDVNVEIEESPRRKIIVHVNRCKLCHDRQPRPTDKMDIVDDSTAHDVT